MDRKSFITLVICGALFLAWVVLDKKLFPPGAATSRTNIVATGTNAELRPGLGTNASSAAVPPPSFIQPTSNAPEETFVLSNSLVRMTFTSRGGGIKSVELLHHRESVTCRSKKQGLNRPVTLNGAAAVPVLALTSDEGLVGDGVYR